MYDMNNFHTIFSYFKINIYFYFYTCLNYYTHSLNQFFMSFSRYFEPYFQA